MSKLTNEQLLKHLEHYKKSEEYRLRKSKTDKAKECEKCKNKFKVGDMKFFTPKFGVICKHCWCTMMGEFIEKHPIHD